MLMWTMPIIYRSFLLLSKALETAHYLLSFCLFVILFHIGHLIKFVSLPLLLQYDSVLKNWFKERDLQPITVTDICYD